MASASEGDPPDGTSEGGSSGVPWQQQRGGSSPPAGEPPPSPPPSAPPLPRDHSLDPFIKIIQDGRKFTCTGMQISLNTVRYGHWVELRPFVLRYIG